MFDRIDELTRMQEEITEEIEKKERILVSFLIKCLLKYIGKM